MRWISVVAGLALALVVTSGCKQYVFLHECDRDNYARIMPQWLESKPQSILPPGPVFQNSPPTIEEPDRPPRYISLAEAIAIALGNGNVGEGNPNNLISLGGVVQPGSGSENIRVIALNPALAAVNIDLSLSKFDAIWNAAISWNNIDRPVGTPLDTFQSAGITNAIEQQEARVETFIAKPLPTGGVAGITFSTDYQLTNLPARVNPSYRPALQFQFEQPLLQGYGVEINQLRASHPNRFLTGPGLNPAYTNPGVEGILITRLRFDQARAEFERRVQLMLLNVESAYWTLYGSYWTLFAQEQAYRIAYEVWWQTYQKFQVGQVGQLELATARSQLEQFRSQRLAALGSGGGGAGIQPLNVSQSPGVLEAERQLRNLLNLPAEDGTRLVPSDVPTLAPYRPDWNLALNEALALRPELILAREEVKIRQLNLILAKNFLMPDLRFGATYDINAIGSRLDGPGGVSAFSNLASNHFNNWSILLNMNIPIGYRQAYANVRRSKLELAQSWNFLQTEQLRAERALLVPYRQLFELHEQVRMLRAKRLADEQELRIVYQRVSAGIALREREAPAASLLGPLQKWANSLSQEYNFIIQYNVQLANFEFAKGTILQHNNVHVAEGPLPKCAQVRAVEHERLRTKALVLAQRPDPGLHQANCTPGSDGCLPPLPQIPSDRALPLPTVLQPAPKLPPEPIKTPPRPVDPDNKKPGASTPPAPSGVRTTTGTVTLDVTDLPLEKKPTSSYAQDPPPVTLPRALRGPGAGPSR